MSQESKYLKNLKFDPALAKGFFPGLLTNIRAALLIILLIIVAGLFGIFNLPRRINPEVNIPIIFISTVLPGASPEDVETLVTEPIENSIESINGISQFSSTSQENVSMVVIEFISEVDSKEAEREVQSAVNKVVNLPEDASDPSVMALDFEDVPVISFTLVSDGDESSLMNFAQDLKKEIENDDNISKVAVSGLENQEVEVLIDANKLAEFNINPLAVQQAVKAKLAQYPAGSLNVNDNRLSFAIESDLSEIDNLRNTIIKVGQVEYKLSQLASISQKSISDQAKSLYADHESVKRAVTFSVFKNTGSNLEESAQSAKQIANNYLASHDGRFQLVMLDDFDQEISDQFDQLIQDFSSSLILVFITLFLFLGIRQAAIASFAIPISFLFTFAAMYFIGIELSFIALFSLLLGLGMIVDDTIVMISAMTDYFRTGKFSPAQTAILVWNDYLVPTLSGNLTNVWSFLPLLLATGIIGEFVDIVAIIVTVALVGSTAIALIVTIPLMMVILKPEIPARVNFFIGGCFYFLSLGLVATFLQSNPLMPMIVIGYILMTLVIFIARSEITHSLKNMKFIEKLSFLRSKMIHRVIYDGVLSSDNFISKYQRLLSKILANKSYQKKVVLAVVIFSIFSYLLLPLGLVENEFFPKTDMPAVYMSLELPESTNLSTTQLEAERLLDQIRKTEGVGFVIADVGVPVSMTTISSSQTQSNLVRFTLRLPEKADQTLSSIQIAANLRQQFINYDKGDLQVVEESGGPPTGADLQLILTGSDLTKLESYALQIKDYLKEKPGVANLNVSIKPGASKLIFIPNDQKVISEDLSLEMVGLWSRMYLSGMKMDEIQIEGEDYPVQLRFSSNGFSASDLSSFKIQNTKGKMVPLLSLGRVTLAQNPTKITHLDGKRSVTISGSVLAGYNRVELGKQLEEYVQKDLSLDQGYSWQTGGTNEENQKSIDSILQAMILGAFLIMATMVVELGSFRKALIVMLVIPLAVSGVFIVFAMTRTPVSFPALIGVMALFGIVVKNAIMMIDKINLNLESGIDFKEAIAEGAASRLEPILFSSVTNIIGLIPISVSDPLWRGLGGAIISGLIFSGTIMLIFIPVVYNWWLSPKKNLV